MHTLVQLCELPSVALAFICKMRLKYSLGAGGRFHARWLPPLCYSVLSSSVNSFIFGLWAWLGHLADPGDKAGKILRFPPPVFLSPFPPFFLHLSLSS